MKKILLLLIVALFGQESIAQQWVQVEVPLVAICDSPKVVVPVRVPLGVQNLGKFRISLRYYNPGMYFNGTLITNPSLPNLIYQYFPGGATDWLTVERQDSTPVNLGNDYLFQFECDYFSGETPVYLDTSIFSPFSQCFLRDAGGLPINTLYKDGSTGQAEAECSIHTATGFTNDTLEVPLYMTNFNNMILFGIDLTYQTNDLSFLGVIHPHPLIGQGNFNYFSAGNKITIAWDSNGPPVNMGDDTLFYLQFKVNNTAASNTALSFSTNPYPLFITADSTGVSPLPVCFNDGSISIITGLEKPLATENQISVYPNPNDGAFDLLLNLPDAQEVVIELYDLQGRLMLQKPFIPPLPGENHLRLDCPHCLPSVYFLYLKSKEFKLSRKLIRSGTPSRP